VAIEPLGTLNTVLTYQGEALSHLVIPDVSAQQGHNYLHLSAFFTPKSTAAVAAIGNAMSAYIGGYSVPFTALVENTTVGNVSTPADSIGLYSSALDGISLGVKLLGPVRQVIQGCVLQIKILKIIATLLKTGKARVPVSLAVSNPFNATMRITRIGLDVLYQNQTVAVADPGRVVNPFNPIVLEPSEEVQVVHITIGFILAVGTKELPAFLRAMFSELTSGVTHVGASGELDVSVGDLGITMSYSQKENVPACPSFNTTSCPMAGSPHILPYDRTTSKASIDADH